MEKQQIINDDIIKLLSSFPNSTINSDGEFIAVIKTNLSFNLKNCKTEKDIKCKILEWFSRDASKTQWYNTLKSNAEYHRKVTRCINAYLNTDFTVEDMSIIYKCLGNAINHKLTIKFIDSGYDLKTLMEE